MHLRTLGLAAAGFVLRSARREQRPRVQRCLSFLPAPIRGDAARLFQHPELQDEERAARKKKSMPVFFFFFNLILLLLLHSCPIPHLLLT